MSCSFSLWFAVVSTPAVSSSVYSAEAMAIRKRVKEMEKLQEKE
jgi:hypothetical protein